MEKVNDDLKSIQTKLTVVTGNRERIVAKKQMLIETLEIYNKIGKKYFTYFLFIFFYF